MANPTVEQLSTTSADALSKSADAVSKSADAAKKIMKDSSDALSGSGKGSSEAVKDLTKAYQQLAARNVENLTAATQALAAVKSPAEFVELQQRLIKDGVEAAVNDSRQIAELTNAVFTAAFEPVKKQIEAAQKKSQA